MCFLGENNMNKIFLGLFCVTLFLGNIHYYGSPSACVTLAGGIIKAKHTQDSDSKYKRKDCPVCKGKGWYMSGDGILKIDCTYCELDKGSLSIGPIISVSPPNTKQNCPNGQCKPSDVIRR
jgi:hypothetical protein